MDQWLTTNWIKVIASIILIMASFLSFETYFYPIMNWIVTIAAVVEVWEARKINNYTLAWIFTFAAVLFNPIAPLALTHTGWVIADIAVAVLLIGSMVYKLVTDKSTT